MDSVTHLPKTKSRYNALLVMVDYVTKMMILRPIYNTAMAVDTAGLFIDGVVWAHGLLRVIVSDSVVQSAGALVLCRPLGSLCTGLLLHSMKMKRPMFHSDDTRS